MFKIIINGAEQVCACVCVCWYVRSTVWVSSAFEHGRKLTLSIYFQMT